MKIVIAYLYYDLLNLYGDSGNVKALYNHLKAQDINVQVKYISINDKKDFSKYDLIYIGSGTDDNLKLTLNDLINYKDEINKAINDGKFILATGNSIELFGDYILENDNKLKCLSALKFYTRYNENRIVNDVIYNSEFIKDPIIGFENHFGEIVGIDKKIITKRNFIGTYIIGPILIRNPEFCKYYIKKIIKSKDKNFKIKKDDYEYEKAAYKINIESIN